MKSGWTIIIFAFILSLMLTLSHALMRAAAAFIPLEFPWIFRVAIALLLYGIVFFVYLMSLKHFDISVLYPAYTALSIIGVSMVGIFYFGESVSLYKIIGLSLLIVGIWLISF